MILTEKYRPETLEDFIGNDETVEALISLLERDNPPHCYLFTGPAGCGKTTLAKILKKEMKCSENDFHELNTADFTGVDMVRKIISNSHYMPSDGNKQIWFCDECHMISSAGQEAFLKIMETPPDHSYFIFCTTEPNKLKQSFKRRCSHLNVSPLPENEIKDYLDEILDEEEADVPKEVINKIIDESLGSLAQALCLLDTVIDMQEDDMLKAINSYLNEKDKAYELTQTLCKKGSTWKNVAKILKDLDSEPESVRRLILSYASTILLKGDNPKAYLILDAFREPLYNIGKPGLILACYEVLEGGE